MEDWSVCKLCSFSRDYLLRTPCCAAQYCSECLGKSARCPSCARVFDIANCTSSQPLEVLLHQVIMECRHEGCQYKSTEFLIGEHEKKCRHNALFTSELMGTLMDPSQTPNALALQRKRNIFGEFRMYNNVQHIIKCLDQNLDLNTTPLETTTDGDYYTHIILDTDTLPGLSIKYKVSVKEIRQLNHMYSTTSGLHERTALRIPKRHTPVFSEAEAQGLEELLKLRLVNRFRRKTGIKESEEALFYLENANMNIEDAFARWAEDESWEQNAPPFK